MTESKRLKIQDFKSSRFQDFEMLSYYVGLAGPPWGSQGLESRNFEIFKSRKFELENLEISTSRNLEILKSRNLEILPSRSFKSCMSCIPKLDFFTFSCQI